MLVRSLAMFLASALTPLPTAYDATKENTAQPCRIMRTVFQQGHCSSCAAFASASSLSMRLCLVEREDHIPSPYRLFDCVSRSCNKGASLQSTGSALMRGIPDIRDSAPLFGVGCEHTTLQRLLFGYVVWLSGAMKLDLYLFGPTIVTLHDSQALWYYQDGVYYPRHEAHGTKHFVVLIGWGADPEPHWLILNSWGPEWGVGGRAKVALHAFPYHYSWRTRTETVIETAALFAYLAFLFFAVAACAVFLPDKDVDMGRV